MAAVMTPISSSEYIFFRDGTASDWETIELEPSIAGSPSIAKETGLDSYVKTRFLDLARQWANETAHVSQVERRVTHPSYQKIIGLGPAVVPLILDRLDKQPDHWFWALRMLVDDDPIGPTFRGTLTDAAAAWVNWGRRVGYL